MKKQLFRGLRLLIAMTISLLQAIPSTAMPSRIENGDEDEEVGEEIIITPYHTNGESHSRSGVVIPFEAHYLSSFNCVRLDILSHMESVRVQLSNLYTGQTSFFSIVSAGTFFLPITHGAGLYSIEFYINNTLQYSGYFTTN